MAVIADEKIASWAIGAGFTGNNVATAVAIALAESGGNPRAHNPVPPDNSYGLWQINMLGGMGPERRKRFNLKSNEDLFEPSTNARVAYALWKDRGNFSAWSTYSNGRYLTYMPRANAAVKKNGGAASGRVGEGGNSPLPRPDTPLPDGLEGTIYDLRDTLAGVKGFVDSLTNPQTWLRVGMFAGGAVLVIVGVLFLIGQSKTARTVASAIPVGRAVRAAKGVK